MLLRLCFAGGWFSILVAGIMASLMLLWVWGNKQRSEFFSRSGARSLSNYLTIKEPHAKAPNGQHENQLMLWDSQTCLSRCPGALPTVVGAMQVHVFSSPQTVFNLWHGTFSPSSLHGCYCAVHDWRCPCGVMYTMRIWAGIPDTWGCLPRGSLITCRPLRWICHWQL